MAEALRAPRVAVVDLACNSPFYCGTFVRALRDADILAELASPLFYLEPDFLADCPRSDWVADFVVHRPRPRALRLALRTLELTCNYRRLLREIKNGRYDIVHVEWVPLQERQTWFMSRLRRQCERTNVVLAFTAHNVRPHDIPRANLGKVRRNVELAHLVFAHTEHVAKGLVDDIGVVTPIAVIPHGPLFADYELPSREEAKERLGTSEGPLVLFLGELMPYKGVDLLAEAWPETRARNPRANLMVVGPVGDEGVRPHLARLAQMPDVVVIDRYVPVKLMLDCYAAADLVVFPYRSISQSGALMTAVGLGRPAVVTPIPGFLEQVRDLDSVVVAEVVDAGAISAALSNALAVRSDLQCRAVEDRNRIHESATGWQSAANRFASAYLEALRKGNHGRGDFVADFEAGI
ncbi:MAG: glycosyltransferase [Armatimonadetes bacterium]|nr:glycosyltransferase [Armatimonadota bacterium]